MKTKEWIDRWVWPLIFGGLLTLALGLAVRPNEAGLGLGLAVVGGLAAVVGAVLIGMRSKMPP